MRCKMAKKYKYKFVDLDKTKIGNSKASIQLMAGKRSIGKTWGVEIKAAKEFFKLKGVAGVRLCRDVEQVTAITEKISGGAFQLYYGDKYYLKAENYSRFYRALYAYDKETNEPVANYPIWQIVAVKNASKFREVAKDFIDIKEYWFFMDEVIIEDDTAYLTDEVDKIMSVISTLARFRPTRFYGCCNTVSIISPLFSHFNLDKIISDNPTVKYYNKNGVALQIFPEDEYEGQALTEGALKVFGDASDGKYWDIIQKSTFNDSNLLCKNKDKEAYVNKCVLELKNDKTYSIDYLTKSKVYYVTDRVYKKSLFIYTEDGRNDYNEDKLLLTNLRISQFRDLFNEGKLTFKNVVVKNDILDLLRYK